MRQQRRLDGLDQLGEAVGDRLADAAAEPRLRADPHEEHRHAGVRADEMLRAFCGFGALQHDAKRVARGLVRLCGVGAPQASFVSAGMPRSDRSYSCE